MHVFQQGQLCHTTASVCVSNQLQAKSETINRGASCYSDNVCAGWSPSEEVKNSFPDGNVPDGTLMEYYSSLVESISSQTGSAPKIEPMFCRVV